MKLIAIDDVVYFQAEDRYTKVVGDGAALIKKPIKELFESSTTRCSGKCTGARS